jgi:hypothetical protein
MYKRFVVITVVITLVGTTVEVAHRILDLIERAFEIFGNFCS